MAREPKLTAYVISLKPYNGRVTNTNRWLFQNLIQDLNEDNTDSFILTEVFRKFISALDTSAMYSDTVSNKCMTANQLNIESDAVNTNILLHTESFVIEGKVEGGSYGRRRNKTSTTDKSIKSNVNEDDAITEDFYFLLHCPPHSNKSILLVQSYSDDTIDSVMKKFWQNFFSYPNQFYHPIIKRHIPQSIIEDFRRNSTVSNLTFSTQIPGETLLQNTTTRNFKITIQVTPLEGDISLEEFENTVRPIENNIFGSSGRLGQFTKKQGTLKDNTTNKTSPFDLESTFEVQPTIVLSKYIVINGTEDDFERIKEYSFTLLENMKPEIYLDHAIQER